MMTTTIMMMIMISTIVSSSTRRMVKKRRNFGKIHIQVKITLCSAYGTPVKSEYLVPHILALCLE
jgi:hypothetical protein